jgi:hypothetical protein
VTGTSTTWLTAPEVDALNEFVLLYAAVMLDVPAGSDDVEMLPTPLTSVTGEPICDAPL